MKFLFTCSLFACFFLTLLAANAQQTPEADDNKIYQFVENPPEFPGGQDSLYSYLKRNTHYPQEALSKELQGLVVTSFVVNSKGGISNVKVLKSLGGGTDEEAIRVVTAMPTWKPGKHQGKEVNVQFTLPIRFTLNKKVKNEAIISKEGNSTVFTFVEKSPQFPGGEDAMFTYLKDQLYYTEDAHMKGLEGLVVLSFIVEADGRINEIIVLKKLGSGLDEVAVRAVYTMPRWSPGMQKGRAVRVKYTLPIRFSM